jgi:hypothetical protein
MQRSFAQWALFGWLLAVSPAGADDLSDFNAVVEKASSHQRVALGYLRTGNTDLAGLEVERMREAWSALGALKRPAAFDQDPQLYTATLVDGSLRLVSATIMIDTFRPDAARDALSGIRQGLSRLRKAGGVPVLADCIGDTNAIMERLVTFDDPNLDWSRRGTDREISSTAENYRAEIARCDAMATEEIRAAPEFRRMVDGINHSLSQFPNAVATHDADLLHRLMGELRAFDNLLSFRYG